MSDEEQEDGAEYIPEAYIERLHVKDILVNGEAVHAENGHFVTAQTQPAEVQEDLTFRQILGELIVLKPVYCISLFLVLLGLVGEVGAVTMAYQYFNEFACLGILGLSVLLQLGALTALVKTSNEAEE